MAEGSFDKPNESTTLAVIRRPVEREDRLS